MWMAYEDLQFVIKDIPLQETRAPLYPISNHSDAQRILAEAQKRRPDIQWEIKGTGPYGVHGRPS